MSEQNSIFAMFLKDDNIYIMLCKRWVRTRYVRLSEFENQK